MEMFFSIMCFTSFTAGCFLLINLPFKNFANNLISFSNKEKKQTIRDKINSLYRKPDKGIKKVINEAKTALIMMGKEEKISTIWMISMVLFIIGVVFSLSINNIFLVPVMAVGLAMLPFIFIIFTSISYERQVNEELEAALSTITTSYIRCENIIKAVEENIEYLDPPISGTFEFFLSQTKLITSNTKMAIENMKDKIQNTVFQEWCDTLISCQDNKNLKNTLIPITQKLSDERVVSAELNTMLYAPLKEWLMMMIILFSNIPIIKALNKDWYKILVETIWGKLVLTLCVLVTFISLLGVIRHTKPIEYKA